MCYTESNKRATRNLGSCIIQNVTIIVIIQLHLKDRHIFVQIVILSEIWKICEAKYSFKIGDICTFKKTQNPLARKYSPV